MRISLFAVLAGFAGDWCLRADGSIEVYFGPTGAYFDQSWPLPDIELVK